jgi:hypothetical protein
MWPSIVVDESENTQQASFFCAASARWAGALSCTNKTPLVTFRMFKSSWMMDPTRSREMPSCSAIDLAEIRRSSKIPSYDIGKQVGLRTYQNPFVRVWHSPLYIFPLCFTPNPLDTHSPVLNHAIPHLSFLPQYVTKSSFQFTKKKANV